MSKKEGENEEVVTPPTPEKELDKEPKLDADGNPIEEDVDFEKELKVLEEEEGKTSPTGEKDKKPKRTELEKAKFALQSTRKRIIELGGNPDEDDEEGDDEEGDDITPPANTSEFVTKRDLKIQTAKKLAKTPSELKMIIWLIDHKNLSAEDAHFLANKGKVKKMESEIERTKAANGGGGGGNGGGGQDRQFKKEEETQFSDSQVKRMEMSGMVYDSKTGYYTGARTRVRKLAGGQYQSERLTNGKWVPIPNASKFDQA